MRQDLNPCQHTPSLEESKVLIRISTKAERTPHELQYGLQALLMIERLPLKLLQYRSEAARSEARRGAARRGTAPRVKVCFLLR